MKLQAMSAVLGAFFLVGGCESEQPIARQASALGNDEAVTGQRWLAGDHHVHSRYSVSYSDVTDPPTPVLAGDAIYPIPMNVAMARRFGLEWMVSTDHGGPGHSKVNLLHAYPELIDSREATPEVIQYMGMEFDTPGADHSSLIMPHGPDEAENLFEIESRFNKREPWPSDPSWDTEERMIEALNWMKQMEDLPLVIAHHPSRSAKGYGVYGLTEPSELRAWNQVAPEIAIGMEGAPGHQAITQMKGRFEPSKYTFNERPRGIYGAFTGGYPTLGGFDQMTAKLGGFWDSMLGEGRRWWITANSDSHTHWTDGGVDFWPGEYSKTYVFAEKNYDSIFSALREGKMFVTTGDLVSEVWFTVSSTGNFASIGQTLEVEYGDDLTVDINVLDPRQANYNGDKPEVRRVDLIRGEIFEKAIAPETNSNPTTAVFRSWSRQQLDKEESFLRTSVRIEGVKKSIYLRLRGTNTEEEEPLEDPSGENPWNDLWFYSTPIFVRVLPQSEHGPGTTNGR